TRSVWSRRSIWPDRQADAGLTFTPGVAGGAQLAPALVPVHCLHIAVISTYRFELMAQLLQLPALVGAERGVLDLDVVGQVLVVKARTAYPLLHRPPVHRLQRAQQYHADDAAAKIGRAS